MVHKGRILGSLNLSFAHDLPYSSADQEFLLTLAQQCAQGMERTRAVEALRESPQRLALTYHNAPVGIVETSLEGKFLEVNDEFSRMLGYSYEEVLTLDIRDVTHPEDLETDLNFVRQVLSGEIKTYSMEKRYSAAMAALAC